MPGLRVEVNDTSIFPLLLFTPFRIVLPFTLNASLVVETSNVSVSSVMVALIVLLPFTVVMLSVLMVTPFFIRGSVAFVSLRS